MAVLAQIFISLIANDRNRIFPISQDQLVADDDIRRQIPLRMSDDHILEFIGCILVKNDDTAMTRCKAWTDSPTDVNFTLYFIGTPPLKTTKKQYTLLYMILTHLCGEVQTIIVKDELQNKKGRPVRTPFDAGQSTQMQALLQFGKNLFFFLRQRTAEIDV